MTELTPERIAELKARWIEQHRGAEQAPASVLTEAISALNFTPRPLEPAFKRERWPDEPVAVGAWIVLAAIAIGTLGAYAYTLRGLWNLVH